MVPVGAIIFIVITLTRVLSGNKTGHTHVPRQYQTRAGWFVLTVLVFVPLWLVGLIFVLDDAAWWPLPFMLALTVLSFPWRMARWICIPLGWPRAAAWFGARSALLWGGDPHGARVLAAAWALLRAKAPKPEDRQWAEELLEHTASSLRGAGIVAMGLLAAGRGELEQARELCRSVAFMDKRVCPRRARALAREWLLAEAAATGRWREVVELSEKGEGAAALARFFGVAAKRLLGGANAPGRFALAVWWGFTGRWWATWPLLKRAWEVMPPPRVEPWAGEFEPDGSGPLRHALALHAMLARAPAGEELTLLGKAGLAWEKALESEGFQGWAQARALSLPASATDAVDSLRDEVQRELAAWALARAVPVGKLARGSALLEGVAARTREEVLERIEAAAQAIAERVSEKKPLSSLDEWRAFVSLQRQCARAAELGGEEARRLAYEAVHAPVCNLGAWLFNQRDEKSIANGMFKWLLHEATDVGTDDDIRRYRNNVNCGP